MPTCNITKWLKRNYVLSKDSFVRAGTHRISSILERMCSAQEHSLSETSFPGSESSLESSSSARVRPMLRFCLQIRIKHAEERENESLKKASEKFQVPLGDLKSSRCLCRSGRSISCSVCVNCLQRSSGSNSNLRFSVYKHKQQPKQHIIGHQLE